MNVLSTSPRAGLCGLFLSLTACTQNQVAETASIPFGLMDGLVILGTLGTYNPDLSGTVEGLLKKGELDSNARVRAFKDPDWAEVNDAVTTTVSQYRSAQDATAYRSSSSTGSSTLYESRGGLIDVSAKALPNAGNSALKQNNSIEDSATFDGSKYKPGSGCEKNLSYLSSRLKKFNPAMINQVRESILSTDVNAMMSTISQQGLSPQDAIQQSLQQADAFDQTAAEALSTVEQVDAIGTSDVEFERAIKSGKLSVTTCSGIRDSALCAAIINKYGAIASRATAANLMCFKRTGQWL